MVGWHLGRWRAPVLVLVLALAPLAPLASADFLYRQFNDTTGLVFVGDSATTSCDVNNYLYEYQPQHGTADDLDPGTIPALQTESTVHVGFQSQATDDHTTSATIATQTAMIGHRDNFTASSDLLRGACDVRLRITASQPAQLGAVWRQLPVPMLGGFQTMFRFQVSDHSRSCTEVKDRHFGTFHHKSCMVHGGDGFAFVFQRDPALTAAIGERGEGMGYAGLRNALVVEFDTWYNPDQGDLFTDHVSVQLASGDGERATVGEHSRMSSVQPHPLGDGAVHLVKITYDKFLNYNLLDTITSSPALFPFLRDGGEGRRIGTFAVYVDDMDTPLIVFPINLSLALHLPEGDAIVGFTASTGRAWEKHDILYWLFCNLSGCPFTPLDPATHDPLEDFVPPGIDHHEESRLNF